MSRPPRTRRRRDRRPLPGRARVLLTVVGAAVGIMLLSAGAAFAYWETTDSSNPAEAAAATLSAPTGGAQTGTPAPAAVSISWTAPTGYSATGYTVLRCAGSSCTPSTPVASGACSGTIATTSCTDKDPGLTAGSTYTYAITASLDSWTSPAGTPFQATTSGAAKLAFTTQPDAHAQIQATGTGTFAVSVAIEDGNGATVSNDSTDTVTLAIGSKNPSNGVLTCTNPGGLTVTASSGVAHFTGCAITMAGKNYKLTATASASPALTGPGNANPFDIVAGAASQLVFTSTPLTGPQSTTANLGPITVQEQDASGNAVNAGNGGVTVGLSASPSAGAVFSASSSGTPITSATISPGSSTASFYAGDSNSGSLAVTAAINGLPPVSQTETVETVQLKITSSPVSGPASATATIGPIKVQLQTTDGTPVTTGAALTLSSTSTGTNEFSASAGGQASTIVIPAGSSKASFYYGDELAGKPTITVSTAGGASDTQRVTVTPASAAGLVFTNVTVGSKGNGSSSSTVTCTGPMASPSCTISPEAPSGSKRFMSAQVGLVDQFGNVVTNTSGSDITVALTQAGGVSVTPSVTITNGSSSSAVFTENLADSTTTKGVTTSPQGTVSASATSFTASITS